MAEDAKRSKLDALGSWQRYGLQICKNFATSEPSVKLYHPTFRNLACKVSQNLLQDEHSPFLGSKVRRCIFTRLVCMQTNLHIPPLQLMGSHFHGKAK